MTLDLTPRLECVLCGGSFERTPADEHDVGATGPPATGLCSGCGTDHPREFVRFWRLGFRDYANDVMGLRKDRDVPNHMHHAHNIGWAAADAAADAVALHSAPYWQRHGWSYGAGIVPLNREQVPYQFREDHGQAFRAGRDALSKGTDSVLSALGLPPQVRLTVQDFMSSDPAMVEYQKALHGEDD